MKRFAEFADPNESTMLAGDKKRLDEILNREIIVTNYKITASKFKESKSGSCLTLQFKVGGDTEDQFVVFTGSTVLQSQIERYKNEIPFIATIKRVGKFCTFT